jgi:pimeloyl-ACP methyl ester carboxylesterase
MDASMFASVKTSAASAVVSPKLEVISRLRSGLRHAPPILFVHGAWHGAWCWDEFFLSYFAAHGFEAHALSLRAHGASEGRTQLHRSRIRHYVEDVAAVVAGFSSAPILVGHSMGGFVVQKFLETQSSPAAFLLASIPPAGARSMYARLMRNQPLDMLRGRMRRSVFCRSYRTLIERGGSSSPPRCHGMTLSATTGSCRTSLCSARSTAWRSNGWP